MNRLAMCFVSAAALALAVAACGDDTGGASDAAIGPADAAANPADATTNPADAATNPDADAAAVDADPADAAGPADAAPPDGMPADAGDTTAPTSVATPIGGVYRVATTVTIAADEPATIYYTTDGSAPTTASASGASPVDVVIGATSTLRFFAVDTANNAETPAHSQAYVIDRLGPEAIDDFTATAAGSDIALSWSNPSATGFTQVVIIDTDDVAATMPATGDTLAVGSTVGPGTVVYVGAGTAFTHSAPAAGGHAYVALARYDTGVFSEGRTAADFVSGVQAGQLSVDVGGTSATVSGQPANVTLSTANFAFDGGAGTATFDLTITSGYHGVTFNPKLVVTAQSAGTFDNADGLIVGGVNDGRSYRAYGPLPIDANGAVTRTIVLGGLAANSTVTLDVAIQHDPAFIASHWQTSGPGATILDLGTGTGFNALPTPPGFLNTDTGFTPFSYRGAVISPDGRYLYAGLRNRNLVIKIDLVSGTAIATTTLAITNTNGGVPDIQLDPSGRRVYAVLNDGMHTSNKHANLAAFSNQTSRPVESNAVVLCEIDAMTMTEQQRIVIGTGDVFYSTRRLGLSRDARRASIAIGAPYKTLVNATLHIVDLSAFAARDFNAGTAGIQGLSLGNGHPSVSGFDWSGRYVLVGASYGDLSSDRIGVADLDAASPQVVYREHDGAANASDGKAKTFLADPNGSVWIFGDYANLVSIVPSTGVFTDVGNTLTSGGASGWYRGQVMISNYQRVYVVDTATGVATQVAQDPSANSPNTHTLTISPY